MTGSVRMQRLQTLFHQAVELPDDARTAFLDQACVDDTDLRAELAALLARDDDDATIAARVVPVAQALASGNLTDGVRIGGYRLIREIGAGGMGSVFLAQRDDREFQHQVAIKVVRGFPTAAILERFRRERELLATLRHPNIARLFDGGTTDGGQPYLVMEYIDGVPLDVWSREHKPSLRQRLRLFQSLCSAVQHAHQQLIVHRDLKPGNVLVRADSEPALLDFGIGKLLDEGENERELTQFRALTPAYASPEQLRGDVVTTLSDIFGLGLILFELLAGVPLRKQGGDTTRINASQIAAAGEDWLRADARSVRGDLDNIVRKALREEPERRYPSAGALSADIEAWFDGRPVAAAPDAWSYRLRKFVARHPLSLGATAATIVALALMSMRLATERDRAVAAQEQARLEAEGANQSAEFLVDLFRKAAPETTLGAELSVRDLVQGARDELSEREFSRPEVKARLETALGRIYISLGLPEPAVASLEQAAQRVREQGAGADPRVLTHALWQLARAYDLTGQDQAGLAAAQEALRLARVHYPAGALEIGQILQTLGVAEENLNQHEAAIGRFEEAEALFVAAGPEHSDQLGAALHNRGWAMNRAGNSADALPILERALALKREAHGPLHPSNMHTMNVLAMTHAKLGRYDEAVNGLNELLIAERKVLGEPSARVASTLNELGSTLQDAGRYAPAEQNYLAAIAQYQQLNADGNAESALPINNLATLLEDLGRLDEAEARYRQALAMRQAHGAQPRAIARGQHNLARALMAMGRLDEAQTLADAAWVERGKLEPASQPERVDTLLLLTRIAIRRGDLAAAQQQLADVDAALAAATVPASQRARRAEAQAELAAAGDDRAAETAARQAQIAALSEILPAGHPQLTRLRAQLP